MSVSSTVRIAGPFTGSGAVSTFPFPFIVFETSDLLVVAVNVATGVQSTLELNTDYTATLNANQDYNPGGSITLSAGPLAQGYSLAISTDIAQLQGTELTNQGGFYPEVLTNAFDLLTILIQQMQELLNRTMSFPITDPPGINTQLPSAPQRAGMYLTFDANGAPQANISASGGPASGFGYSESISTLGQLVFVTPLYTPGANNLFVVAGGLVLTNGVDYTETTKSSITLTQPSPAEEFYTFRSFV